MDGSKVVGDYIYHGDRSVSYRVRLTQGTAWSGGFDPVDKTAPELQHFPMPNGYMRYMTVRIFPGIKPLRIPVSVFGFGPFVNGGDCQVIYNGAWVNGKVINTFGERWDHNLFRLDTEVS